MAPASSSKTAKRASSPEPTSVALVHPLRQHTASNGAHWQIHQGDTSTVLLTMPPDVFHCCITSPPYYWQRDYGVDGQIGKEATIAGYVGAISNTFEQVRRVLRPDGVLFLNMGDTYYSAKGQPKGKDPKNRARRFGLRAVDASGLGVPRKTAIGIPWRVALEMISRGWILRSAVIWHRANSIPEPTAHDRPWRTYEHVFIFAKTQKYWFNRNAVKGHEDIWSIPDRPRGNRGLHSAAFPDALVEQCLEAGCPPEGVVLDPFSGSGTVLRVAIERGHAVTGVELNAKYCEYASKILSGM
jgi:DNA modification methylase